MANEYLQCPEIIGERQIRPKKIPGGFVWAVCFRLPVPAQEDGYIVQQIVQTESGSKIESGVTTEIPFRRIKYWEAWEVKKGETEPQQKQTINSFLKDTMKTAPINDPDDDIPMNDIFFKQYSVGTTGNYGIGGVAGFYRGPLPSDFIVGRPGAGALKSTPVKPVFWTNAGWGRSVSLGFRCETEAGRNDDSIQTFNADRGRKIDFSFADKWLNAW